MATGLVRVRILKKSGGSVPTTELFKEINDSLNATLADLGGEWEALESKYLA